MYDMYAVTPGRQALAGTQRRADPPCSAQEGPELHHFGRQLPSLRFGAGGVHLSRRCLRR